MSDSQDNISRKRYLISSVLSPAVQLWLRSQADRVDRLDVKIKGRNLELLNGSIPSIAIAADRVVYQGLHLTHLYIKGENIRVNFKQILKGQPLRLLDPVTVNMTLRLEEADLNASLASSILHDAIHQFFQSVLPHPIHLPTSKITLDNDLLVLTAIRPEALTLRVGLELLDINRIQLVRPQIRTASVPRLVSLEDMAMDLGSDVKIEDVSLSSKQLFCRGAILVRSDAQE
jgi:LmeA-like phospholipid-binding